MSFRSDSPALSAVHADRRRRPGAAALLALAALVSTAALSACTGDRAPTRRLPSDMNGEYVAGEVDSLPRVEYAGIGVTLNDRCMVRQSKLNRKMRPMYVNNHPVGFC
jgi:hypothetical protein